ncbi:MAG: hypothetical protein E7K72_16790, partial [Roseomonas mucosa]|nr:hypothetical protein [Roseomonas mucosa]
VLLIAAAVLAPWLSPTDPYDNDLSLAMQPPGAAPGLWLGADAQGRNMVTRLLYGLRMSLLMGLASVRASGPWCWRCRSRPCR